MSKSPTEEPQDQINDVIARANAEVNQLRASIAAMEQRVNALRALYELPAISDAVN